MFLECAQVTAVLMKVVLVACESDDAISSGFDYEEVTEKFYFESSDFCAVVSTKAFVDKTMLIREFFRGPQHALITAPSGFGKSTNLDMVKTFVENFVEKEAEPIVSTTEGLVLTGNGDAEVIEPFDPYERYDLKIGFDKTLSDALRAQYPVIYLGFKLIKGVTMSSVVENFKRLMFAIFSARRYLLNSKKIDKVKKTIIRKYTDLSNNSTLSLCEVERSLLFLSKYLHMHFKRKVIVLIDDFDAPVAEAMHFNSSDTAEIIGFLNKVLTHLLYENKYVERALIFGGSITTSRVVSAGIDVQYYPFLGNHRFSEYFGFTESEVKHLVYKFNISSRFDDMKQWYYGYLRRGHRDRMFNVWSVLHFLRTNRVKSYWVQTVGFPRMLDVFLVAEVRDKMATFVRDRTITVSEIDRLSVDQLVCFQYFLQSPLSHRCDNVNYVDLFFHFLLDSGYLHVIRKEGNTLTLTAPNAETAHELIQNLYSSAVNSDDIKLHPVKDEFLINTLKNLRTRYYNVTYFLQRHDTTSTSAQSVQSS